MGNTLKSAVETQRSKNWCFTEESMLNLTRVANRRKVEFENIKELKIENGNNEILNQKAIYKVLAIKFHV